MADILACGDMVWSIVDRATVGDARPSAALVAPAAFVFGAGQVKSPAAAVGPFQLGIDEPVDGLVADDAMARFTGEASGDLLG
jgi:hypothetical protein